jgi:hypothetical protein
MGLPKVQLAKKAAMVAENGEVAPSNAPVVLSMVPTSTPPAAVVPAEPVVEPGVPAEPVVDWKAEHEAVLEKYRSLTGIHLSYQDKINESEARIAQMQAELQRFTETPPMPPVVDTSDDWTEEERATYGPAETPVQKVARREAKKIAKQLRAEIDREIGELRNSQQQVGKDLAATTEQQFLSTVKANVKNFEAIIASPKWADYAATRIPYTQMKVSDALGIAHNNRDLERVLEIFSGFKPVTPTLKHMESPPINGSAAPSSSGGEKPILRMSDRKKLNNDFRLGRLDKDPVKAKAKLDLLVAEFTQAEQEGRLDYNS